MYYTIKSAVMVNYPLFIRQEVVSSGRVEGDLRIKYDFTMVKHNS